MKKTLLLLNFCTISIFAQFNENFDASNSLPLGWTQFGGTNGNGVNEIWEISSDRSFSGSNAAYIQYDSPGLCEDWLVTPLINLAGLSNPTLTFYGGQTYSSDYGNSYQIKISTTSQTDIASFTTIATYSELDFESAILGPLITQKTVDLSAYTNQQIYIAFFMQNNDGDDFYVDNVSVNGSLETINFDQNSKIVVFPNPTNGIFNVSKDLEAETIKLYDVFGKLVKVFTKNQALDISNLPNQMYFLQIEDKNQKTYRIKILKN